MGDKFIGLVRVSTKEQEESGLGLKAGYRDIEEYVKANGGELVTILEEVESGTHKNTIDRPILDRAIAMCKRRGAILLVPKVDRLLRSTEVHTDIKRSGIKIRAVDQPHANEFTLDILVAVAANEARAISDRTRKGLREYREHKMVSEVQMAKLVLQHGAEVPPEAIAAVAGKLGAHLTGSRLTPEQQAKGRAKANARSRRRATEVYSDLIPEMQRMRASGMTLAAIADQLTTNQELRKSGAKWTKTQVKRVLDRAAKVAG